jgi:phosphomannomutase/phosphomannomutase/phosphoglucomutase
MDHLTCFKAYDVRGRLGEELNEDIAERIGRAFGQHLSARRVAVGRDARPSSPALAEALIVGLRQAGTEVLDIGLAGTEEIYFAAFSQNLDGGLVVTGSHNPLTDNGIKFIRGGARPMGEADLSAIRALAERGVFSLTPAPGAIKSISFKNEYIEHLLSYIQIEDLPGLRILVNPGHGTAGPALDLLEQTLAGRGAKTQFIKVGWEPDGAFPLGLPNPLLPENRAYTAEAVRIHKADLGLAWDGDFDRCFFFDEKGEFIEGYYLVGLLAETFLAKYPGASIIHDPRLTWNTIDMVERAGGRPIASKTGHAFMKAAMRAAGAVYGGEMSAHHYFADFGFCDSGMIPWLLVLGLMGRKVQPLSSLVAERQALFPCSGELNFKVADGPGLLAAVEDRYGRQAITVEHLDGLSLEMPEWRFNLRASNTEPLIRLNLESRGRPELVAEKAAELEGVIRLFQLDSEK